MKALIRIQQVNRCNEKQRFSFIKGIQTVCFNLKSLLTHKILLFSNGWYETSSIDMIIADKSLIVENNEIKWIDTVDIDTDSALLINQKIN